MMHFNMTHWIEALWATLVGKWEFSLQSAVVAIMFFFYFIYIFIFFIRSSTQAWVIDYAAHHGPQYKASSGGWTWDLSIDSNSCAGRHQWSLCNCHCCVGCRSSAIILIKPGRLLSHWAKTSFSYCIMRSSNRIFLKRCIWFDNVKAYTLFKGAIHCCTKYTIYNPNKAIFTCRISRLQHSREVNYYICEYKQEFSTEKLTSPTNMCS